MGFELTPILQHHMGYLQTTLDKNPVATQQGVPGVEERLGYT